MHSPTVALPPVSTGELGAPISPDYYTSGDRIVVGEWAMMHCECGWAWEWDDDSTPYCPFCGKLGAAGPGTPEEARRAVEEAQE